MCSDKGNDNSKRLGLFHITLLFQVAAFHFLPYFSERDIPRFRGSPASKRKQIRQYFLHKQVRIVTHSSILDTTLGASGQLLLIFILYSLIRTASWVDCSIQLVQSSMQMKDHWYSVAASQSVVHETAAATAELPESLSEMQNLRHTQAY